MRRFLRQSLRRVAYVLFWNVKVFTRNCRSGCGFVSLCILSEIINVNTSHGASEKRRPNRVELGKKEIRTEPNRTEPNRTDDFSKSPEPKRIATNRFLPVLAAVRFPHCRFNVFALRCTLLALIRVLLSFLSF